MGSLSNQVSDNMIDPGTFHFLSDWQNIEIPTFGPDPAIIDPSEGATIISDQMNPSHSILESGMAN